MSTNYSASGFLYHSPSQQILLQKLTQDNQTELVLFRGQSMHGGDPYKVFQLAVEKYLHTTIHMSLVKEVYDYIHNTLGKHFIFYVEFEGKMPVSFTGKNSGWFPLARLSKYPMSEQTRHDIIIGERVIRFVHSGVGNVPA